MQRQTTNENDVSTFSVGGFSFDYEKVFILLFGHFGSAGVGVIRRPPVRNELDNCVDSLVCHYADLLCVAFNL